MDALDAIGDPELRETLRFVRGSVDAVSADEAAVALGVHRSVARSRLERLAEAELLTVRFERRSGRAGPGAGRPAKLYEPAPELRFHEFPEHRFAALVGRLVDELPERRRARVLRSAGEAFGAELAHDAGIRPVGRLRQGLERACAALRGLGFQASVAAVDDRVARIRTPTCPLRPLVAERPEVAELDRGMWAGLVAASLRDVEPGAVSCVTCSCLDREASCEVLVTVDPVSRPS